MTDKDRDSLYRIRPIGVVRSKLKRREDCPRQGREGAPDAWLVMDPDLADGLDGVHPGSEFIVLTWFHEATRNILKLHPRGNPANPLCGVFATRSPDRPNPIGLHRVRLMEIGRPLRLRVCPLEALDGTPVIDIKPVLPGPGESDGTG